MTRQEFLEYSDNYGIESALCELQNECDCVTDTETLKDFARENIDNDNLLLATHILEALDTSNSDFWNYDYSMGTLETPTPIAGIEDIEQYLED